MVPTAPHQASEDVTPHNRIKLSQTFSSVTFSEMKRGSTVVPRPGADGIRRVVFADSVDNTKVAWPSGEGNGTPLQYSGLENPMDGEVWWAVVHGVAKSWTRLKRLNSSSSLAKSSWVWVSIPMEIHTLPGT